MAPTLSVPLAAAIAAAAVLSPKLGPLSAADILAATALLGLGTRLRQAPLPPALAWAASLWVVAGALSGAAAILAGLPEHPALVVLTVLRRFEVVAMLALGALAGYLGGRRAVRTALLAAVLAAAAIGISQHLLPDLHVVRPRAEATARSFERGIYVGQANHFGGLFAMAIALALPLAAAGETAPERRAGPVVLAAALLGLLTTGSRTALAAAALGGGTTALLAGRRALLWWSAAVIGGLAALPAAFRRRLAALGSGLLGDGSSSALSERAAVWSDLLASFGTHPLVGTGPGTRGMNLYDSEILLALEGGGILGALALLLLAATLWLALRGRRFPGETGALVALLALGVSNLPLHVVRLALPFALAAGAALGEAAATPGRRSRPALPAQQPQQPAMLTRATPG